MKVLVINSGSSSIKYELFDMSDHTVLASGLLERIGQSQSRLKHRSRDPRGEMSETVGPCPAADHREGLGRIVAVLSTSGVLRDPKELFGIGHRVVHGGEDFREPTLIDQEVIAAIRRRIPLAPLHNPANIVGIEVALAHCPEVPQVAVFDTAFHQSIPAHAFRYAIPHDLYAAHGVRRYGFHGTSHRYVAKRAATHLGRPPGATNLIVLHLGNGASAAAIEGGLSVDTSMGMTPLEGLMMGTRCGDLDPAVVFYLARVTGQSNQQVESLLNNDSGLKGICGTNDMREVLRLAHPIGGTRSCPTEWAGHDRARLAIAMYTYRVKKYIGAYCAVLSRVDAIVFTAGIGENSPEIRQQSCRGLSNLGILIDPQKNSSHGEGVFEIQADPSAVKVLVIPTDEEFEIAEETVERIQSQRQGSPPPYPD